MCRLLVYRGPDILMAELLTRPEQSLIRQSYKARERAEPLNGDGFGVGWYAHDIDHMPCVFTSIRPAWSNRNLLRLADKVRTDCFFAHVRAATAGMRVSEANCHPFQYDRFLWMHNGRVAGFDKIKRRLRGTLNDEYYNFIEGNTDTEHAFALFLNNLGVRRAEYSAEELATAMMMTIGQLEQWTSEAGATAPSFFNFALTDGYHILITRYTTSADHRPETLYLSRGAVSADPDWVIIASEPVTEDRGRWEAVPRDHLVLVTPDLRVQFWPIPA